MNEDAYAKQVISVLDNGLVSLRPEVVQKLQSAREHACALASQRTFPQQFKSAHSLTWVDWIRHHRVALIGMLLVLAVGGATLAWQTATGSSDDDTASIDTQLLTGDLPVNAYLDGHLSKWVSNSSAY